MTHKRLLITGGAGFIGRTLARHLAKMGFCIRIFDKTIHHNEICSSVDFVQGDLNNFREVVEACHDCQGIVHLGGVSRESLVRDAPLIGIKTNIMGGLHLLEAIKLTGNSPWLLIGSTRDSLSLSNSKKVKKSLYGISKATVDQLAEAYVHDFGGRIMVTRFADVYGALDDHPQKVLPLFFRKASNNEPLEVNNPERLFDFIHIDDLIQGVLKAVFFLESKQSPYFQEITFCTGKRTQLQELARLMVDTLQSTSQIILNVQNEVFSEDILSDPIPANNLLGFKTEIFLQEGLKRMATPTI